jgi:hypothetical protein
MGKVLVVFILDVSLLALLNLESKLIAAAYTPSPLHPIEIISLRRDPQSIQGGRESGFFLFREIRNKCESEFNFSKFCGNFVTKILRNVA